MESWALGMLSDESRRDWNVWTDCLWRRTKSDCFDLAVAKGVESSERDPLVFGVSGKRLVDAATLTGVVAIVDADVYSSYAN